MPKNEVPEASVVPDAPVAPEAEKPQSRGPIKHVRRYVHIDPTPEWPGGRDVYIVDEINA